MDAVADDVLRLIIMCVSDIRATQRLREVSRRTRDVVDSAPHALYRAVSDGANAMGWHYIDDDDDDDDASRSNRGVMEFNIMRTSRVQWMIMYQTTSNVSTAVETAFRRNVIDALDADVSVQSESTILYDQYMRTTVVFHAECPVCMERVLARSGLFELVPKCCCEWQHEEEHTMAWFFTVACLCGMTYRNSGRRWALCLTRPRLVAERVTKCTKTCPHRHHPRRRPSRNDAAVTRASVVASCSAP